MPDRHRQRVTERQIQRDRRGREKDGETDSDSERDRDRETDRGKTDRGNCINSPRTKKKKRSL